jgi:hypothetical protein
MEELIRLLDALLPDRDAVPARLVRLPEDRPIVFVGDIHGDREAVDAVLSRFPVPEHTLVFLGDIVDRGPDSLGSLMTLVRAMLESPDDIHLLMGNHEARALAEFYPADFWEGLSRYELDRVADRLLGLPLAAWHRSGILAVHGALPDVDSLEAIDSIELGSDAWRAMTWGDWVPTGRDSDGTGARPAFDVQVFRRRSAQLGVTVLVRSHQPSAPTYLFDDRCLTLFTSTAYGGTRHVARLIPGRTVDTARDLEMIPL